MKNSILLFTFLSLIVISFLGFTGNDNNYNFTSNIDVKKISAAANDINSLTGNILNSNFKKESNSTDGWDDNDRSTLKSLGFNPDKFHPSEIFGSGAKELTMPDDSTGDALSQRYFTGAAAADYFGWSVSSAGDVNGDGYADIIIGAYGNDAAMSNAGRAYIYYGGPLMDAVADVILTGAGLGDNFGNSVSTAGDVNGDGYSDVIVGARYNDSAGTDAGAVYIYFGGILMNNIPDVSMRGATAGEDFGYFVSSAGDVNGDGYGDIIVGADKYNSNTGRAYIFYGGSSINEVADVIMTGEAVGDYFGCSVSTAGDVNGDGYSDVVVGAYQNDAGGINAGRAYIYFGGSVMNNTADVVLSGLATSDYFGYSVSSAGDVNADGYSDVIAGAYGNDAIGSNGGRAYVYYGGVVMNNTADVILTGEAALDNFGFSVSSAGDVNCDGYSDVIVGAYLNDAGGSSAGRAYVFYGGASMNPIPDLIMTVDAAGDYFAHSVSSAGDVNGDGYADVLIGAPYNDAAGGNAGRAYLYMNSLTGSDIPDESFEGEATNDYFGSSVASAGDVNGDGYDDIIVGAYGYDTTGISNIGRAYIYFGGVSCDNVADVIFTGESSADAFGMDVSSAGDVNGDGYADVIIGASSHVEGRAYIYFGGAVMNNAADVILSGENDGDNFGLSVSSAGDVNGDGYSDVITGAYSYATGKGKMYIYYGGSPMNNVPDVTVLGEANYDFFGGAVSNAGDVNGDGYSDVIVGGQNNDAQGINSGRAYIFYGGSPMDTIADVILNGYTSNDCFGNIVSNVGDVNGDGYSDVIVGAPYDSTTATKNGRAYIFFGGAFMNNVPDIVISSENADDNFPYSCSSAGDVNGDGYSDVIIGSRINNLYGGKAKVYFGGSSMDNIPDITMVGADAYCRFGKSVSSGDINGDGYSDVIVGDSYYNDKGSAYLFISSAPAAKPTLISVKDFPNDQGGKVTLNWARSAYDMQGINKITGYKVQRAFTYSNFWEDVATITPGNQPYYSYTAATGADSIAFKYRIKATTAAASEYWLSEIKIAFSVDNLAPAQVKNLAGNMDTNKVSLHWKKNTESDLAKYRIYRNEILLAESTDTLMNDLSVLADSTYQYKVAAVDIHGNEGPKSDSVQFSFGDLYLNLTALIEGFYDNVTGKMIKDTVTVTLKNTSSPYNTVHSSKIFLDSLGQGTIKLPGSIRNGTYYIVINHRNSLETWSKSGGLLFNQSNTAYNFTSVATQAYGSNMIQKGTKWCIYSGDANQDGAVDFSDLALVDNDNTNFVTGYTLTDLNGDSQVDFSDLAICDNNNNNFISTIRPPGAPSIKFERNKEEINAIEKYKKGIKKSMNENINNAKKAINK